jgi:hypothetical protein
VDWLFIGCVGTFAYLANEGPTASILATTEVHYDVCVTALIGEQSYPVLIKKITGRHDSILADTPMYPMTSGAIKLYNRASTMGEPRQ